MEWTVLTHANACMARKLFNDAVESKDMIYKTFSEDGFSTFFLESPDPDRHHVNILEKDGRAFASGCYIEGQDKAYITIVVVHKEMRRKGLGKWILGVLEEELIRQSGVSAVEIVFFNPMNLEWEVPGTPGHDHPNAPGVDMMSASYLFFKNMGYRDFAYQNSYYIELQNYIFPEKIMQSINHLKERGITITHFDISKHSGMEELFADLKNPLWSKEILSEITKPGGGRPIVIAEHLGTACGFTGPLEVSPGGRGYFAGIGVHSSYRGGGVAKVLFSKLCSTLKDMGAEFMTLFTGETNPARNIYEAAGFKIVRSWADMKKDFSR